MALVTYPLNNIEYSAEDAELFHVTRTSGVYANNSFDYSISGSDNTIIIGTGIGWIKNSEFSGKVIALKEEIFLNMGLPDSVYPRIDAIVIKFDANTNETNIVVKQGVASSFPIAPSVIRSESVYELHLYHVRREAGSLYIAPGNITDLRLNGSYCGLMADSVTKIDTTAIELQISNLIENLKEEIENVENTSEFWMKNDVIPISNGGTGSDNEDSARKALKAASELTEKLTLKYASEHAALNDILNVNLSGNYESENMQSSHIATEDASTLVNSPITSGAFYAYRTVKYYPAGHIEVCLEEMYPCTGRVWANMYDKNLRAWRGWNVSGPVVAEVGKETITNEVFDGRPVYTKLVNCGVCPSQSIKMVAHGASVRQVMRVHASLSTSGITAPYMNVDNYNANENYFDVTATATNVIIKCTTSAWATNGYTVVAQIWYTKP